jgi:hypothetical protein
MEIKNDRIFIFGEKMLLKIGILCLGILVSCSNEINPKKSRLDDRETKESSQDSSTEAFVSQKTFKRAFDTLGKSVLMLNAIPFQFAPDGCYARAFLMSSILAAEGIPSSQSYVFAGTMHGGKPGADFEIEWNGKLVRWGYHVAPLLKVEGGVSTVVDPSVNKGIVEPILRNDWVAKFKGKNTVVHRDSLAPGSCYVTDSFKSEPRPGCKLVNFSDAKMVTQLSEMPQFRVQDFSNACSVLYTYLAAKNTGYTPAQVTEKREQLWREAQKDMLQIQKRGLLTGQVSEFWCGENSKLLENANSSVQFGLQNTK